jgi:23S rRNA (guanosine2251-2'-O)-methyltransferase
MTHIEGRESVLAALAARQRRCHVILVREGIHRARIADVLDAAAACGVAVRFASRRELDALAHGATHGGVVAVCSPRPLMSAATLLERVDRLSEPPLLLLIEGVDDARNLGFTIRTADALGVHALLIKRHLWDFDEVEVARPAGGAFERLPLVRFDDVRLLAELQRRGLRLIGFIAGAKRWVYSAELTGPVILAIGGEKRGLSSAVRSLCDGFVTIPTSGSGSSLALSHAAAIAMAEASRQRGAARPGASGPRGSGAKASGH